MRQWVYSTPPGYRDEPWSQCFFLNDVIAAFETRRNIVIQIDRDQPGDSFEGGSGVYLTGFEVSDVSGVAFRTLGFRFFDAFGRALSSGFVGSSLWGSPIGNGAAYAGGYCPVFEPYVYCPFGSVLTMQVRNFFNVAASPRPWEFRGWKRLKIAECPA